jgi:hypothetical protein
MALQRTACHLQWHHALCGLCGVAADLSYPIPQLPIAEVSLWPIVCAGTARQHLHKWIAAASVVQRAVRSWLLRRGLRLFTEQRVRSLNAVVRLQALWRGRAVRRQYMQLRQAAICIQVFDMPPINSSASSTTPRNISACSACLLVVASLPSSC